jgi:TonB family protein
MITIPVATLSGFWFGVANHLWQSTLFLAALFVIGFALRDAPGRIENRLWWLGLLKFLIPVSLVMPAIPTSWTLFQAAPATTELVSGIWQPVALAPPQATGAGMNTPIWLWLLTVCWLSGMTFILYRGIAALIRSRVDTLEDPNHLPRDLRVKLDQALRATGVQARDIGILQAALSPFVTGILKPMIVISREVLHKLNRKELQAVLLHEDAHRRRREPLLYGIQLLTRALFYYFPPLWLLLRKLHDTTERTCDERAMDQGSDPASLHAALAGIVALHLKPSGLSAGAEGRNRSPLGSRLDYIRTYRRRPVMMKHRLSLLAGVAVFLLSAFITLSPVPETVAGIMQDSSPADTNPANLDGLAELATPVGLQFKETPLEKILQALSSSTSLTIRLEGNGSIPVTIDLSESTLGDTLSWLQTRLGLEFEVTGSHSLIVRMPFLPGMNNVTNPIRIPKSYSQPVYPEAARKGKMTGTVILQVIIRADGTLSKPQVLREEVQGYGFAESAMEAVQSWRYEPATLKGEPVPVFLTVHVQYSMDNDKDEPQQHEEPRITL